MSRSDMSVIEISLLMAGAGEAAEDVVSAIVVLHKYVPFLPHCPADEERLSP